MKKKSVEFPGLPNVHGSHPPDAWHPRIAVANVGRNPPRERGWLIDLDEVGSNYPKAPWDVMGCQVVTCFKALFGVSLGGSGVSIGGVRSLRVVTLNALNWGNLDSAAMSSQCPEKPAMKVSIRYSQLLQLQLQMTHLHNFKLRSINP